MSFKQLWGSTTYDADDIPTRTYATLAVGTHFSAPFAMRPEHLGMMGIEIDTSGDGAMIASAVVLQRSSMGSAGALKNSTAAGVHWHDVPAAEATFALPAADGLEQMEEFTLAGAAMYRLRVVVSTEGNVWAGASPGGG